MSGAVLASVLAFGTSAGAAAQFTDPSGDTGGPDVTGATVSNDFENLTIAVRFANRPTLASTEVVLVDVDADANGDTGEDGVDLYAAFEGDEEPAVFAWKDGAFAEAADAKAAFENGTALLTIPLSLVTAPSVALAVLAVGGPDPDFSPTDRAPDSGRWTYTVEVPKLQTATVRFKPAKPRAGKRFAVASASLTFTVVGTVAPDDLTCDATLGGKALAEVDSCAWRVPRTAKGKLFVLALTAGYRGKTFRLPIRKLRVG